MFRSFIDNHAGALRFLACGGWLHMYYTFYSIIFGIHCKYFHSDYAVFLLRQFLHRKIIFGNAKKTQLV